MQTQPSYDSYLDIFLEMLSVERGAAHNTRLAYVTDLTAFKAFLATRNQKLETAEKEDIRAYLSLLTNKDYKRASQARKLSTLRHYYGFLQREQLRKDNPTKGIQSGKREKHLPAFFSIEEVTLLIKTVWSRTEMHSLTPLAHFRVWRLTTLVELLYSTGMRVSELVSLPLEAVREENCDSLYIRGKGGKERLVPVSLCTKEALSRYWPIRNALYMPSAYPFFFPAKSKSGHITRQAFARDLKALAVEAGLRAEALSPHALRHAFASHLLQRGINLRILQQVLGHSDISSTQIYTHVLNKSLCDLVEACHPLSDKRQQCNELQEQDL